MYYRLTLSDSPTPPSRPSANRRLGTGPTTPSARRSTARSVYNASPASCCTRRRWASGCPRGGAGTGGVGRTPRFGAATAPESKRWLGCGMACSGGYPPRRRCRGRINTRMLTRCTSRASPRPRPRCGRNEGGLTVTVRVDPFGTLDPKSGTDPKSRRATFASVAAISMHSGKGAESSKPTSIRVKLPRWSISGSGSSTTCTLNGEGVRCDDVSAGWCDVRREWSQTVSFFLSSYGQLE